MEFRNQLLKTAEIAGSTVTWFGKSHYLLANVALVGEAIALAMRTSAPQTSLTKTKSSNAEVLLNNFLLIICIS